MACVIMGAAAMVGGFGCQMHQNALPDPVIAPPPPDEAMALRDWQQSSAVYANTSTVAGNTGFMFMPKWDQPEWVYPLLDAPIFLLNVVTLPYSLIVTPPWKPVEYRSATIEPTYTAMPPLPPPSPEEPGRPSDLATPPGPSDGAPSSDVAPPVVFPTNSPDRPAQPMNEASQTLPRPNPNPPVPAAPAQQRTSTGEPVTRPSTNLIVPSTNPTMPPAMNK
jgi:hypothetical protein